MDFTSRTRYGVKGFSLGKRVLILRDVQLGEINEDDFKERKLVYVQFLSDTLSATNFEGEIEPESFKEFLDIRPTENWFLIGLDGGLKSKGSKLPKISDIFRIIDAMPMRQSEMRKGKKDGKF
ncbi:DUF4174 domain-containing protein [Algoriphagus hitonicola]|uniref:DUF4174 domain-containing protein n=1 Tax=Algoriphagus hitonicola TaxID=435880 RepID=UPI0036130DE0